MAGFNYNLNPAHVYSLLIDNIKMSEVMSDPVEAKRYGVDYLRA